MSYNFWVAPLEFSSHKGMKLLFLQNFVYTIKSFLQIERGRYQGALRQDRLCLRCTSGEIDDEKHFLISCSTCPVIRTEMFSRINNICQNFDVLDPEQKLYWLLNNENEEILASICNLIKQSNYNIIK